MGINAAADMYWVARRTDLSLVAKAKTSIREKFEEVIERDIRLALLKTL